MAAAQTTMELEIAAQADLLPALASIFFHEARAILPRRRPELIVLAARGSSDHACRYARYIFEAKLAIPCTLAAPSVLTRYHADLAYPRAWVIGVSQSAAAPDVAAVLEHARHKGHFTLSITNVEQGPVVDAAEAHLFLGAGPEIAVAATKTFTATLLAFHELARAFGAPLDVPSLEAPIRRALEAPEARAQAEEIRGAELSFALARGHHFAIAEECALKLMECALIPCRAFSLADFAHGPIALAGPRARAVLFDRRSHGPTELALLERLRAIGMHLLEAPEESELSEELRPLPAAIFAQRIALEAAKLGGLDPDRPRNLEKVTRTH
ncbi:MAG: SIS domain-containing protein [Deltaproteobacteria bacterium]|nr:SIS domain-containing protein [Deltaproteobacteria bacterium]